MAAKATHSHRLAPAPGKPEPVSVRALNTASIWPSDIATNVIVCAPAAGRFSHHHPRA